MHTVITGATGLIGGAVVNRLLGGVALTRDPARARARLDSIGGHAWEALPWEPEAGPPPAEALRGARAVINLAGESVADKRWSSAKKRRIRDSRVVGTRNLVAGLATLAEKPEVLVSASAVGYFGDRGDETLDEQSPAGRGFLAEVCREWEREALAAEALGIRVVCVRIGVVLAPAGGAIARMLMPFKLGVGGRLGSGRQWMPWVHIDDVVGLLLHSLRTEAVRTAIHAVAPNPVTNTEFAKALGHALRRPALLAVPEAFLHLAFGDMSEVMTASQRVVPRVAQRTGYTFAYSELSGALAAVLKPQ